MTRRVVALAPDASVREAAHSLLRKGFSGAPVATPDGQVLGVFTEHDCIKTLAEAAYSGWPSGTVADHMTRDLEVVASDLDLLQVSRRFSEGTHRRLLVMEGGRLVGLVSRSDLLRALDRMLERDRSPTTYELIEGQR